MTCIHHEQFNEDAVVGCIVDVLGAADLMLMLPMSKLTEKAVPRTTSPSPAPTALTTSHKRCKSKELAVIILDCVVICIIIEVPV